ncbi:helix-turn-helix transcriptional regulator [Paenibacillus silviterrae]|uniref:helix-turn-helix transcriptional regulator n=1 Tax=Paenibacillus silviterrae TaxID=3242194 RepID=UPI0025434407|nr:helix-turn-helix transcriptional regulator [Paenibacillus chinjuensis]
MDASSKPNNFLVKQKAFLKMYLFTLIERDELYGLQFQDTFEAELSKHGYRPSHSDIYKILHEMYASGWVTRTEELRSKDKDGFQKVIYYRFTDEGRQQAQAYKKLMKVELERCIGLLQKALQDNYS